MNKREELKAHIVKRMLEGKMTVKEGADRLRLSERQVKRLKKRGKENGVTSVLHRNCGRQPKHTLTAETKQKILLIRKDSAYDEVNYRHFQDILEEHHGIKVSYSALRNLLIESGYKSPKTQRKRGVKHIRRERKESLGDMLQMDGSYHQWFQGNKNYYTLHGAIDDATGEITGLYMCDNECMEGYMQIMRQTIRNYGVPKSIYVDGLSVFFSRKKPTLEEELAGVMVNQTQFGNMMSELGVHMIHARSSQAKGRIERAWGTLQGRLITEFAIHGITTSEQANVFFSEFLKKFNKRFSVKPKDKNKSFMPKPKGINLDRLFALKLNRTVDNSGCFSLENTLFQVNIKGLRSKTKVTILISEKLGVKVLFDDKLYTPIPILTEKKVQIKSSSAKAVINEVVFRHCLKNERAS